MYTIPAFCDRKSAALHRGVSAAELLQDCLARPFFLDKYSLFALFTQLQPAHQSTRSPTMLLTMLYLPLLGALMPLTSIAFPTTSNTAGMSKNIQDQLFGRDQAANERLARSVTNAKSAKTDMIPTSIDPTDNTPIYTFTNSNMPPPSDIFTNVSSPGLNDAGSSVINFKWGFGPVVVRRKTPLSSCFLH